LGIGTAVGPAGSLDGIGGEQTQTRSEQGGEGQDEHHQLLAHGSLLSRVGGGLRLTSKRKVPGGGSSGALEVAVASRSRYIVTYNQKDFGEAARFGIEVLTQEAFLRRLGV
jgi:hypothetical protein